MKVLINAISAKMGGAKIVVISFIENIDENDGNEYYFLICKNAFNIEKYKKKNTHIIYTDAGYYGFAKRIWWYQVKLPLIIKKNRFDRMINLTNFGPLNSVCKEVSLIHNPRYISKEMWKTFDFKEKIKVFFEDILIRISLKGTDKLVVQTNYMKQGIINKFKYPATNIYIIPNVPAKINIDSIDYDLERKLNDFIGNEKNVVSNITLYVKHKNLERMLQAVKHIKDNNLCTLKLIITIEEHFNKDTENLIKMIKDLNIEDYVFTVGTVNHENIHQILNKSKAFIFPSYAESLGIPFIEAIRFNIPVVAADLEFAHNVCGDAAVYFKYDDIKDMAEKIVKVVTDDKLLKKLKKNCMLQSESYDDKKFLNEYMSLIE